MKAIEITDNQSLIWTDVPTPSPGDNEVAIRVHATAVNRADLAQRKGLYPPPPGASEILGLECSGIISAVGEGVSQWQTGDRVCALLAGGGYAETVVCPASQVLPIPRGYSFIQAAALPEVFATAWLNIFMEGQAQPGERVLLHAGASGVGTAAIQLCVLKGNPCFVTVGDDSKLEFCKRLGAAGGCNRKSHDFSESVKQWTNRKGFDIILDPVGGSYLERNIRGLNTDGRLINIGIMGGRTDTLDMGRLLVKRLRLIGSTLRSRKDKEKSRLIASLAENVWPHIETGDLKPVIHRSLPITSAVEAFAEVESNNTTGKVILEIP
jgi:putative PIG3 family NAD(P)H quinone oxidoreductase